MFGTAFGPRIDPARDSASTPTTFPQEYPQAMANDRKQGFLSSLFGKRKQTEVEATAELESKQRLEARIQQILAEKAAVSELLVIEEKHADGMPQEEEAEVPVELFPISASVIPIRKAPPKTAFVLSAFEDEAPRSYASNQRR
jgi:hypothetical protein